MNGGSSSWQERSPKVCGGCVKASHCSSMEEDARIRSEVPMASPAWLGGYQSGLGSPRSSRSTASPQSPSVGRERTHFSFFCFSSSWQWYCGRSAIRASICRSFVKSSPGLWSSVVLLLPYPQERRRLIFVQLTWTSSCHCLTASPWWRQLKTSSRTLIVRSLLPTWVYAQKRLPNCFLIPASEAGSVIILKITPCV